MSKSPPDPRYEGRSLSEWIAIYQNRGHLHPPDGNPDAALAIRQIGTNAIPSLLSWMAYEPPMTRYHLMPICQRLPWPILTSRPIQALLVNRKASDRAQQAMEAFAALGPLAAPAAPELIRRIALTNAPATRDRALVALAHLGELAVPTVAAVISTPEGAADLWRMACVRQLGTNARPLIPILIQNLHQTNGFAAMINARTLGQLKFDPDLTVPALTKCLQDSRREVRMEAPIALSKFGSLAQDALTSLTNALSDPDLDVRRNASRAIDTITRKPLNDTPVE